MGYLRISNEVTGKIELEMGIRPDPFFLESPKGSSNLPEPSIKTPDQLITDIKAMASFIDFKKRGGLSE